jgi:hypothetical protein
MESSDGNTLAIYMGFEPVLPLESPARPFFMGRETLASVGARYHFFQRRSKMGKPHAAKSMRRG